MQKVSVWGRVAAWGVVFGLLAIVAVQLRTTQLGVVRTGEPAPEFNLVTFDSQEIGPEEMRGKILVVNFWASWCKPCEQEAADLQAAWEVYAPRGDVLFIGVDYVDTENEALKYIERFGITYPNGPDLGTRTAQAFRLQGVPETFFVDRQGQVAYVQIGPFTGLDSITSIVDRLLEN
ncbi:MAG: TlpA disulfide reductase family protein [Chloroflexi bacterium]|nr:TlpA disulfide reductase family protein [Chloroflexota bacterium]